MKKQKIITTMAVILSVVASALFDFKEPAISNNYLSIAIFIIALILFYTSVRRTKDS